MTRSLRTFTAIAWWLPDRAYVKGGEEADRHQIVVLLIETSTNIIKSRGDERHSEHDENLDGLALTGITIFVRTLSDKLEFCSINQVLLLAEGLFNSPGVHDAAKESTDTG